MAGERKGTSQCGTEPTGLFGVRETFDTTLISVVDGPILKLFEVVIVNSGRSYLVYKGA